MKSIYDHFTELTNNQWNYYQGNKLNGRKPFSKNISHKEFIEQYLKDGEKSFVYSEFEPIISNFKRYEHTNSVFFLGCVFFEKLNIKSYPNYFHDGNSINEFYFMWFLTSLMHDFAYEFESDNKYNEKFKDIESFKEYKDISNDLLDDKLHLIDSKTFKLLRNVEQYFQYRFHESKKIDHGITGGLLLFDLLEKNRLNRLEQQKNKVESNNLYWGEEVKVMYIQACRAIATHNIWKAMPENKETYIQYGLDNLVDDSIYPISIDEVPYLFLLGLLDSLDPVKIFDCVDAEYVIKNLLIDFKDENTIIIKNKEGSGLIFSKLIKRATEMKDWLHVQINVDSSESLQITLP